MHRRSAPTQRSFARRCGIAVVISIAFVSSSSDWGPWPRRVNRRVGALRTLKCERGVRYARSADAAPSPQGPRLRRLTRLRSGSLMDRTRHARLRTRDVPLPVAAIVGVRRSGRRWIGDGLNRLGRAHTLVPGALLAVALFSLAACSGNDHASKTSASAGAVSSSTRSESSATLSPGRPSGSVSASSSTQVEAAVSAYSSFSAATFAVERHPAGNKERARLAGVSFDPARGKQLGYAVSLTSQGVAWRGSAPTPRTSVLSINLNAKPWPTVVVSDCPTPAPTWEEYVVKTGAAVPVANSGVSPPFQITADVILYQGHWGVQSTTVDRGRTCSA